jgi:hypothetical protein
MKTKLITMIVLIGCVLSVLSCLKKRYESVTVPFHLDHNRMLIDAEIQRQDESWRFVKLWVDTGNPDFFISEALAKDLGIPYSEDSLKANNGQMVIPSPAGVRINGLLLDFEGVRCILIRHPVWLFSATHNDANLPSSVLKKHQVIFDYPKKKLTLAEPGTHKSRGEGVPADVHPQTGIVQIDVVIDEDSLSFALDNGASYSFGSEKLFKLFSGLHPDWPILSGAIGHANIWGWGPREEAWPMIRMPMIQCGPLKFEQIGLVCPPAFTPGGPDMMDWYSQKTARPIQGFFGPNLFRQYRIEIDYVNSAVYFKKGPFQDPNEMNLVGLTLRPEPDSSFKIIGISDKDGMPSVEGVQPGDILVRIDDLEVKGSTMGTVIDALRGKPGDIRVLELKRDGSIFKIEAEVKHFL